MGEPSNTGTSSSQFINEALPRSIHLSRTVNDGRELHVAWQVKPGDDPYPAKLNLFGSEQISFGTSDNCADAA
jgi:hypothetical protein